MHIPIISPFSLALSCFENPVVAMKPRRPPGSVPFFTSPPLALLAVPCGRQRLIRSGCRVPENRGGPRSSEGGPRDFYEGRDLLPKSALICRSEVDLMVNDGWWWWMVQIPLLIGYEIGRNYYQASWRLWTNQLANPYELETYQTTSRREKEPPWKCSSSELFAFLFHHSYRMFSRAGLYPTCGRFLPCLYHVIAIKINSTATPNMTLMGQERLGVINSCNVATESKRLGKLYKYCSTSSYIQMMIHIWLYTIYIYMVGGFKHDFYFPFHIWDVILPIDQLIFFKMIKTTNHTYIYVVYYSIL